MEETPSDKLQNPAPALRRRLNIALVDKDQEHLDLSGYYTSHLTSTNEYFKGCNKIVTLNLSGWDTTNVTDTERMFHNCTSLCTLNRTPKVRHKTFGVHYV